jgi:hypothetical protein
MKAWLKKVWFNYKFKRAKIHMGFDMGSKDIDTVVFSKFVDGKIYIIDIKQKNGA